MNLDKLTWYVSRSGGIVAWTLLALSLILGLLLSSRILGRKASPAWTLSVHRFLGALSVIFTAIHVAAIMLDDFVDFGLSEVLVPWASSWRPSAVAWGVIGMYLMVAIEATSFAMRYLPKKLWRAVHWMSAPLFVLASLHGYQAGADAGRVFIVAIAGVVVALTVLTTVRVIRARRAEEPRPDPRKLVARDPRRREMRAEPPTHVLNNLTLSSRPLPEVPVQRELATVGASRVAKHTQAPVSLAEALPPVPPTVPELPAPAPKFPEKPPPATSHVVNKPDAAPVWPRASFDAPPKSRVPKTRTTPQTQPPAPPRTQPAVEREDPKPLEPVLAGALAAEPAFGMEPPRPSWSKPVAIASNKASETTTPEVRRPGPAPGVWKRSVPKGPRE